ncbi:copper resistance protein CopC [Amycolatopsis sp. NBC_01307]|uniref:copper resistance CopC family protein n=1 Tax=Amycolatopsis sp. NBC_01307 TaxID=2903561 RepID=UPI002E0DDD75|nr:copper resistance protein CopC [Amycolatopsis sp. NBC_01307]
MIRRALTAVFASAAVLLLCTPPASAHTELTSSSPAEGASLAEAPSQVQLTFEEPVTLPPDAVKITGRDGTAWPVSTPVAAGNVVTAPVTPAGPAQAYTLTWKVIAKDGDNVTGTLHFTLTAAATAAPATRAAITEAAPTSQTPVVGVDTSSFPGWVWIVVAVVGLLAVIVVGLRFLRGGGPKA